METFSALLALCAGNSPVTGEFPAQRPVTLSFDVFFGLNKRLSKQSWGWWFETPSRSLWRHCNDNPSLYSHPHDATGIVVSWFKVIQGLIQRCREIGLDSVIIYTKVNTWHETLLALLALCGGNPPVDSRFLSKEPRMRSFGVTLITDLDKLLNRQSCYRWMVIMWHHPKAIEICVAFIINN